MFGPHLVQNRTATVNQIRSLEGESGVIFSVGRIKLQASPIEDLEDGSNDLSYTLRSLLKSLYDDLCALNYRIEQIERDIKALCQNQPRYEALLSIPGFGPLVTASFIIEVGPGLQFKNGSADLRVLLIHGARAVGRFANKRQDKLGQWFNALSVGQGKHKVVVALANKLARIAWKILTGSHDFDVNKAFA